MERQEFAKQFQAIYRRLWLVAAGCVGDRADAEDIVQEAAVIAFRKRNSFELGTSFGAWVTRIVRLCAANHNRKVAGRKTRTADPTLLDEHIESTAGSSISGKDLQADFDDVMLAMLNQLNDVARASLLLRVVDGLSYAEIAEMLEIPEGTAMSHVYRSKKALRDRYLGDCVNQKGDAL